MSRNVKTTNYIFTLVVIFLGGPSLIWGTTGLFGALLVMGVAIVGALVWTVIYAVVEINNG
jgi:hypothetical protein